MLIINQDRDDSFMFEKEYDKDKIHVFTVINNNKLFGFNLMFEDDILGNFATYDEAEVEMIKLLNYDREYFIVSGFDETYEYEKEDDFEDDDEDYNDDEAI